MEKKEKIKKEKAPKTPKKSKMPEGYIGRPKPMKTKTFEFHKPTVGNWIAIGFLAAFIAFATYIVLRLIDVSNVKDLPFAFYNFEEDKENVSDYVLENSKLKFVLDPLTTNFTVTQKDTGRVWSSSPAGAENDPIALAKEKNYMNSSLLIKYSTENGVDNIYDTKTYSVDKDFYSIEKTADSVTVNYTIGQIERIYRYPLAIYEPDMKVFLSKMTKDEQNVITKRCYKLVDVKKLADNKAEMLEKYPDLEKNKLYLVFDPLNNYLKESCEDIFDRIGFTNEDYAKYKEIYKEKNEKDVPAFNVSVVYKLDGNKLLVDVPFDSISYKHAYPIIQLSVLPYFGASTEGENGFMLVPEGGGSLIYFNNGKTKQNGYYADLYGWDYGIDRKAVITETKIAYPVFGEAFEESSFITVIKNGAEYAGITAEIAGKLGNYNYIRADYKMIHGEQYEVSSRNTSAQYAYEANLPKGESITQVYSFINSNSYVDMAKEYQKVLFADQKKLNNESSPLAIEIIGAVDKVQQVAGMPKTKPYQLTTYDQAADIINQIEELGFKNVNYKLSGFFNGGISQKIFNKFKLIDTLGGKKGFNKLIEKTKDLSANIYLDGSMQFAYRSGIFDGFNRYSTPARFVSSEVCELNKYSPVWYGKLHTQDSYFYLNPYVSAKSADLFTKTALKYGLDGISYRDNGSILSADYNDDRPVSRSASKKMQIEKMKEAKDKGLKVMINSGNDYALNNVDFITNMDFHGNAYSIIDLTVPFYQIALHGYKNYSGSAVNLGYEKNQIVLESAETGAGLFFTVMNESEMKLQETNYTEYYAACFDTWKEQINQIYSRYNKEIGPVANSCITDHAYVNESVTATSFDNGYKVFVNFGYVDFVTDSGLVIPARDYKVVQEVK